MTPNSKNLFHVKSPSKAVDSNLDQFDAGGMGWQIVERVQRAKQGAIIDRLRTDSDLELDWCAEQHLWHKDFV